MFIWSSSYSSKYLVLPILAEKQKTNIVYEYLILKSYLLFIWGSNLTGHVCFI